jgi:hypothetical protein
MPYSSTRLMRADFGSRPDLRSQAPSRRIGAEKRRKTSLTVPKAGGISPSCDASLFCDFLSAQCYNQIGAIMSSANVPDGLGRRFTPWLAKWSQTTGTVSGTAHTLANSWLRSVSHRPINSVFLCNKFIIPKINSHCTWDWCTCISYHLLWIIESKNLLRIPKFLSKTIYGKVFHMGKLIGICVFLSTVQILNSRVLIFSYFCYICIALDALVLLYQLATIFLVVHFWFSFDQYFEQNTVFFISSLVIFRFRRKFLFWVVR